MRRHFSLAAFGILRFEAEGWIGELLVLWDKERSGKLLVTYHPAVLRKAEAAELPP